MLQFVATHTELMVSSSSSQGETCRAHPPHRVYSLPEGKTVLRSGDAEVQTCCYFVCSIDPGDIVEPLIDKKTLFFFFFFGGLCITGIARNVCKIQLHFFFLFFFSYFRTIWMLGPLLPQH